MSHQSLKDSDRAILGAHKEERLTSNCTFCGATERARRAGYAGCVYCRRGGERTGPIGGDKVPTCSTAFWIASKEKHFPGGFTAFCARFNLNEAELRAEAAEQAASQILPL